MTVKFRKVPLFGEGIFAGNPTITRERRLNCYFQLRKDNDRTKIALIGTPGMLLQASVSGVGGGTSRGIIGQNGVGVYNVIGNKVYLSNPAVTSFAAIPGTFGGIFPNFAPVSMANSATQLVMTDGISNAAINMSAATTLVNPTGFPAGATSVVNCNGFFVAGGIAQSNEFFVSTYNDGTTWNALSFGAANQVGDYGVAVDQMNGILIPMGSAHIEFWQDSGLTTEPFTYIQGTSAPYGLLAPYSRAHVTDGGGNPLLCFVGISAQGGIQICAISNYQVKPISTPDIDTIIRSLTTPGDCVALTYQTAEASFVQFTFQSDNRSLLFNATNGTWGETQTGVTFAYAARHIGQFSTTYVRPITTELGGTASTALQLITDYSNSNVYVPDVNTFTDNGNVIVREVITRAALNNQNVFRCGAVYFDMETGVGLTLPSQQGYSPQAAIAIARDSRNFGPDQYVTLGRQGAYGNRVIRRRCGRARFMHVRLRVTDPVKFVVGGGAVIASSRGAASFASSAR